MKRRDFLQLGAMASVYPITASAARLSLADRVVETEPQPITLNANRVIGPLPHVWEEGIGSDRAVEGLRSQWQSDLRLVRAETGIKAVRFHGVFNDEMGVCPGPTDRTNFLYIDMVYDSILALGMKPFVELSFMPRCVASGKTTVLWYKANTSPPTDFASWGKLVQTFAQHLIERYGMDEVRQWKFEVWNEPNIIFWSGTKEQYFELYRTSSLALKSVSSELKVGGPSTAEAWWILSFSNSARQITCRLILYRRMSILTIRKGFSQVRTISIHMRRSSPGPSRRCRTKSRLPKFQHFPSS